MVKLNIMILGLNDEETIPNVPLYTVNQTAEVLEMKDRYDLLNILKELGFLNRRGEPTQEGHEIGIFYRWIESEKYTGFRKDFTWDAIQTIRKEIESLNNRQEMEWD